MWANWILLHLNSKDQGQAKTRVPLTHKPFVSNYGEPEKIRVAAPAAARMEGE